MHILKDSHFRLPALTKNNFLCITAEIWHRSKNVLILNFINADKNWNGQTSQLIVSSADTTATLRGLTPVTTYYIRVIAENSLGRSEASDVMEIITEEEGNYYMIFK